MFSLSNFKVDILKKTLEINQADAFLIVSDTNRYWLAEFESSFGFIVVTRKQIHLLLDKRYYQKAIDTISNEFINIICFSSKNQIIDIFKENNVKTLMIEKEYFGFNDYIFVKDHIETIIPFTSDILRIQKTEQEIEYVQKACDIVCETMNWIQQQELIGKTEIEISNMFSSHMLELGATKNSFDPIVASGENGAYPHHKPTDRKIQNNEFLTIDAGCIYKGYCSDLTRTFPIGTPNEKLIKAYNTVLESNETGIMNAKFKMLGSDVDKICRDVISTTEFKEYFVHSTGHGVGINIHELPNTSPTYNKPLEENSICTIEPGIYIPGLGGIRIEDMILIKKDKVICMTKNAKKWIF